MFKALKQKLSGLAASVVRYPAAMAFFLAAAVLTAISISGDYELTRYIFTCVVGALSCAAGQMLFERYFSGMLPRIVTYLGGVIIAALFYLSVYALAEYSPEILTRFAVTLFALFIAFIWLGVIRGPRDFGESFMAGFKALFEAAFFSGVLFLGCILIIAAIDQLITPIDEDAYMHTTNIVFILIAPMIFLSLIPVYPGKSQESTPNEALDSVIDRRTGCPKFLEVLLSYIIIPLTGVFTIILLVYILLNIGGTFWTDNLLEPMLVAYTIVVIIVTLLVLRLENRIAELFIKIFPKVLIPIALFQIVASALLLKQTGMTFGRYYVLLYGAFAVFAGATFSLKRKNKSGIIAPVLIALSLISLIPPVDAFTVSRNSQIATLEQTLEANGMLQDNTVTPNASISEADKTTIISAVRYLSDVEALDEVNWIPDDFEYYNDADFNEMFGFSQYDAPDREYTYVSVYYDNSDIIPIAGYDVCTEISIVGPDREDWGGEKDFTVGNEAYTLFSEQSNGGVSIGVRENAGVVLGQFDMDEVYARYASYSPQKTILTLDEAAFSSENDALEIQIIVLNASFSTLPDDDEQYAQILVFIKIK